MFSPNTSFSKRGPGSNKRRSQRRPYRGILQGRYRIAAATAQTTAKSIGHLHAIIYTSRNPISYLFEKNTSHLTVIWNEKDGTKEPGYWDSSPESIHSASSTPAYPLFPTPRPIPSRVKVELFGHDSQSQPRSESKPPSASGGPEPHPNKKKSYTSDLQLELWEIMNALRFIPRQGERMKRNPISMRSL